MNKIRRGDDKGFIPLDNELHDNIKSINLAGRVLDNLKLIAYNDFLSESVKSGAKVFVVISPYYDNFNGTQKVLGIIYQTAHKYNVDVMNFSQNKYFLEHREYFQDEKHLNRKGASVFSEMLSGKIKPNI